MTEKTADENGDSGLTGFDIDPKKIDKPVTRGELWMLLLKVDMLIHTARSIAFYAAYGDREKVSELMDEYKERDKDFVVKRDELVCVALSEKKL